MRRAPLAAAACLVVLATAGCGLTSAEGSPATPATPAPSVSAAAGMPSPTPRPSASASADEGPQPLPASTTRVTSLEISSIGLKTSGLERLQLLPDQTLAAPKDPDRAGWFAGGTVPGQVGPAVIAGHVDSKTGPAVFYDLGEVERGDTVRVGLSNGKSTRFRVDAVVHTAKDEFPTDRVYGPTPDVALRLITCSGPYDRSRGGYLDNTVVFASAD